VLSAPHSVQQGAGDWSCVARYAVNDGALSTRARFGRWYWAASLPGLRHMRLACHGPSGCGVMGLAAGNWPRLEALSLSLASLPATDARALATSTWVKNSLVALKLTCPIGQPNFPGPALGRLVSALQTSPLEELRLAGLHDDACAALEQAVLPHVRLLELGPGSMCAAQGFLTAVCSAQLPSLTHLLIVRPSLDKPLQSMVEEGGEPREFYYKLYIINCTVKSRCGYANADFG